MKEPIEIAKFWVSDELPGLPDTKDAAVSGLFKYLEDCMQTQDSTQTLEVLVEFLRLGLGNDQLTKMVVMGKKVSPEARECLESITGYGGDSSEQFTPQDCLCAASEILDSLPEDNEEMLLHSFRILSEVSALAVALLTD